MKSLMNKVYGRGDRLSELLAVGYAPGEPLDEEKKLEFLKRLPAGRITKISLPELLIRQVRYMRPLSWIAALLFLAAAAAAVPRLKDESLWTLASCTPVLALAAELEVMRSYRHGMAELESTARFSLKAVCYARFLIVGILYFSVMLILSFVIHHFGEIRMVFVLSGLLIPYFVTMTAALLLERTAYGRSSPYAAFFAAGLTAAAVLLAQYFELGILQVKYGTWWEVCAVCLLIAVIALFRDSLRMQEDEVLWNW